MAGRLCVRVSGVTLISMACCAASAPAALLVYEGFNGYSDITTTTTPNANTVGLNKTIAYAGNGADGLGIGTGLTLGSMKVSGSGATFSAGTVVAGAQLSLGTSPYQGTLWGSYLINLSAKGGASGNGAEVRISNDDSTGGIRFRAMADSRTNSVTTVVSNGYDTTNKDGTTALAVNTTYILISKFTNVGVTLGSGTTGQGSTWALTETQFGNFMAGGGLESDLNSAGIGTGATQVTARISDDPFTGVIQSFANGNRVQFVQVGDSGTVDEIRFGSTLEDVTPIPEPAALVLGLAPAVGLLLRRQRGGRAA